jgi:uncharacterized protein YfiM (DUF2279 family)
MKKLSLVAMAALASAGAALAHDTTMPYDTRGAASAMMSNEEKDRVLAANPHLFSSKGEVSSFLTRAFTCDLNEFDGMWYISDHRRAVLGSDWFQRRNR